MHIWGWAWRTWQSLAIIAVFRILGYHVRRVAETKRSCCKDVDLKSMILALLGLWWHGAGRLEKKKEKKGKKQPQLMKHCIALNAERSSPIETI